jgi:competence ComEA-like helix-hairpin-helix protein
VKKKRINSTLSDYFNFSARERRGALFLAFLLILQIIVLFVLTNYPDSVSEDENILFKRYVEELNSPTSENKFSDKNTVAIPHALFSFDPNSADDSLFGALGFSEKQIKSIRNYMSHGGKFRVKSDFKKMYAVPANQYASLEPYLLLPDSAAKIFNPKKENQKKISVVDLSTADSIQLTSLRGIGPVLASRIVRYREKLGGFVSISQLKEVWGITDSLIESLSAKIVLNDSMPWRLIHLNTDSFSVFASHPYLKGKLAGLICSYRKQHGTFSNIEEMKNIPLVTDENFRKLAPYIRPD